MSCLSSSPVPVRSRVTGVSITIPGSVVIMVIPSHPLTAGCSLVTMLYNMGLTVKEEFLKISMNQNKWIWFRWRRKKRRQNYISQWNSTKMLVLVWVDHFYFHFTSLSYHSLHITWYKYQHINDSGIGNLFNEVTWLSQHCWFFVLCNSLPDNLKPPTKFLTQN